MNREQKINHIKYFLQKFGERNYIGFVIDLYEGDSMWQLGLEYSYNSKCVSVAEPYCWCVYGDKHFPDCDIKDRTDEELDKVISRLTCMIENKAQDYDEIIKKRRMQELRN